MEERKKELLLSVIKNALRIVIGLFFIATAVMKLLSLDTFELYIYSFKLFNYAWSAMVARGVIFAEMLLGSFLIAKIRYRESWWLTMAMLIGFTLLLAYTSIFRNDDNCHCMGELVQLNPGWSIVKNLVIIALLIPIRKEHDYRYKGRLIVAILLTLASIAVPFGVFPTDSVYALFSKEKSINTTLFDQFEQDSLVQNLHLDNGNYIFAFISADCKYCKLGTKKLVSITEQNQIDPSRVVCFIWGTKNGVRVFQDETGAKAFQYVDISPIESIQITNGAFPTFVFVQQGKVERVVNFRGLDEKRIRNFLKP